MPLFRRDDDISEKWREIANVYRFNGSTWQPLNALYRKTLSNWEVLFSRNLNSPTVSVAPTLSTGGGSQTDFTHTDTITLTRGTWTRTGSSYSPVYYDLKIQSSTSSTGPWSDVTPTSFTPASPGGITGYNNYQTVSYSITRDNAKTTSLWFRGRVQVKNDSAESSPFTTTPVRSRLNLSVSSTVSVTTYADSIDVGWTINTPADPATYIDSQTIKIITNSAYTYNGKSFNSGDVVHETTQTPGTSSKTIFYAGTDIRPSTSYVASVVVVAKDSAGTSQTVTSSTFSTPAAAYSFGIGNRLYVSTNGYIGFDAGGTSTTIPSTGRVLAIYPHDLQYNNIRVWSNENSPTASTQYVVWYDGYQFGQSGVAAYRLTYMAKFYTNQPYVDVKIITRGSSLTSAKTIAIYSDGIVYSGLPGPYTIATTGTRFRLYYTQSASSIITTSDGALPFVEIPTSAMVFPGSVTTGSVDDGFWNILTANNVYTAPSYSSGPTLSTRASTSLSYTVTGANDYAKTKWVARTGSHSGTIAAQGTYDTNTTSVILTGLSASTTYYITFTPINSNDQQGSSVQATESTSAAVGTIEEIIQKQTDVGYITVFYRTSGNLSSVDKVTIYATRFYTPSGQNQTTTQIDYTPTVDGGKGRGYAFVYVGGFAGYADANNKWNVYVVPKLGADVGAASILANAALPNSTTDAPRTTIGTVSTGSGTISAPITFTGAANRYTLDVKTTSYNGTSLSGYPKQNQSGNVSISGLTNGTTYYMLVSPYYYYYVDPDHTESDFSNSIRLGGYEIDQFSGTPSATTYAVTYFKNTTDTVSNMPNNQTKTQDVTLTLSSTTPTRTGYTFGGWNTASNGGGTDYSAGGSYTGNAALDLYAKWTSSATKPGTPTDLSATTNLSDKVTLTFSGSSGADSYDIYWSSGTTFRPADTATPDFSQKTSPFDDTGILAGNSRYYFVRGYNAQGTSTWYPTTAPGVQGTRTSGGGGGGGGGTAPATPTGLTACNNGSGTTISWNSVTGATSYELWYQSSATQYSGSSADYTGITTTSYDPGFTGNFYWFVRARNSSGASSWSTGAFGGGSCAL